MLTGQMELADKDEHNQIDYEAIITDLVDSLDTALEDPQAFLDAVRVYLAPQVHHALRNAFLMLNSAYGNFMNDALDKKIIPDWGS